MASGAGSWLPSNMFTTMWYVSNQDNMSQCQARVLTTTQCLGPRAAGGVHSVGKRKDLIYREKMHSDSTKPVMLWRAPLIPATRWSCSQQSLLSAGVRRLQLHVEVGAHIRIT